MLKKSWNSQFDSHSFEGNLPSGIDYVCFANLSRSSRGEFEEIGFDLGLYEGKRANIFFYPTAKACEMPFNYINRLDLEKITKIKNPNCVESYLTKEEIINDFIAISVELDDQFEGYTSEDTLALENFLNNAGFLDKYSIPSEGKVEHMKYVSEDKMITSYGPVEDSSPIKKFLDFRLLQYIPDIPNDGYLNQIFNSYEEKTHQASK